VTARADAVFRAQRARRASFGDWPSAAALLREIDDLHAAIAPAYFCSGIRAESEWRRLLEDGTSLVLVVDAPAGSGLAGLLTVRIYDTPASPTMVPRRRGHVESLVVGAAHRRRGIGRLLMDEVATWARACGAVELVLTTWAGNDEAEAFYRRLGYQTLSSVLARPIVDVSVDVSVDAAVEVAQTDQAAAGGRRDARADRDQTR
jgi:ribosomal protein S18 acetylase RimI-like enzyme